jgi:hypothetical protein
MEQTVDDGVVHCWRWSARTMRIYGNHHGHTPRHRVMTALQVLGKEWLVVADRPVFYLTLTTATSALNGMDALIAATSTEPPVEAVIGQLQGVMGHTILEWVLDDLAIPRYWFPAFPV